MQSSFPYLLVIPHDVICNDTHWLKMWVQIET